MALAEARLQELEECMHYKNGREAKAGDPVVGRDTNKALVAGVVVGGYPEADACNIYVATFQSVTPDNYPGLGASGKFGDEAVRVDGIVRLCMSKDLLHAEDAMATGDVAVDKSEPSAP